VETPTLCQPIFNLLSASEKSVGIGHVPNVALVENKVARSQRVKRLSFVAQGNALYHQDTVWEVKTMKSIHTIDWQIGYVNLLEVKPARGGR
jgi:hypothetical protein